VEGSRLIFLLAAQGFRVIAISISWQGLSFALPEFWVFEISVFLQQIHTRNLVVLKVWHYYYYYYSCRNSKVFVCFFLCWFGRYFSSWASLFSLRLWWVFFFCRGFLSFGGVRVGVLVLELGRMAGAVTQDDIEELRRLLHEAKRPRVQFILSSQISTLEKVSTLIMMVSSSWRGLMMIARTM
jgi:hypothetical protein